MSHGNLKDLRKQLHNVVKELLPEVLTDAMTKVQYEILSKAIDMRLSAIEKHVKENMHEMNTRQKDTLSMLVRQVTVSKEESKS